MVWLFGIKSFEVDKLPKIEMKPKAPKLLMILSQANEEKDEEESKQNQLKKKIHINLKCELCHVVKKKQQVSKVITMKMLYELKSHLQKRGIFSFDYLDRFKDSTDSCKICDVCYLMVVAERELIEIEKLYAIAQSIPIDEESKKVSQKMMKAEHKILSDCFKNKLK